MVVDSLSSGNSLRTRLDLSLLHRAQQAGVLWSSFVVLVGGSEHGGAHARRENGTGTSEVLFRKQKYGMNWRMSPRKSRERICVAGQKLETLFGNANPIPSSQQRCLSPRF